MNERTEPNAISFSTGIFHQRAIAIATPTSTRDRSTWTIPGLFI
jgi:hypothetical protein